MNLVRFLGSRNLFKPFFIFLIYFFNMSYTSRLNKESFQWLQTLLALAMHWNCHLKFQLLLWWVRSLAKLTVSSHFSNVLRCWSVGALITFLILQPRATLKFPLGEVSVEEREDEEEKRTLSINGILKSQILNGVCTAQFGDEDLKLRYSYKVCISFNSFYFLFPNSVWYKCLVVRSVIFCTSLLNNAAVVRI